MKRDWFKDAVVYQVYTRSFSDSNGDGIGDFRGIINKLDYLSDLGIDILWLSPFCSSPDRDNGYDISDYLTVTDAFGSMADLDELIAACRDRGIWIMMDLVLNHTSDQHEWFKESRSSKDNPRRDYYIWAEGKDGAFPNNWQSYFEDEAWALDETTGEYYLHQFYAEQPDLNWRNDEVRKAMTGMIRMWQSRGINAFRLDAIHHVGKPDGLPDAPEPASEFGRRTICNTEETHEILRTLSRDVFIPGSSMTVGETGGTSFDEACRYVDADRDELNMVFHFDHVYPLEMSAQSLKQHFSSWYEALSPKGWDTVFFCNHDLPRHISIFGNDTVYRQECAKSFAVLLLTLWGTPYIYQGEELGMTNVRFESLDDYPDESSKRWIERGISSGFSREESEDYFYKKSRDNARTPMQWDSSAHAGFTKGTPWIKINPNYLQINAADQMADPSSVFSFYKSLIAFRKKYSALRRGSFSLHETSHDDCISYIRSDGDESFIIFVNFSDKKAETVSADKLSGRWISVAGTHPLHDVQLHAEISLAPWESRIYRKETKESL